MPKIREGPEKAIYKTINISIQKQMVVMDMKRGELAEKSFMKYTTLCKRLKQPETWVLEELVTVMQVLKMDLTDLAG